MKREDQERLARAADAAQQQAEVVFENALATCGRLDVMVFGALDGGFVARRAALAGARVVVVDADESRLNAAAEASQPLAITWRTLDPANAADEYRPGQFDSVIGHFALAATGDLAPLFRSANRLLQTDGTLALSGLHPAFTDVARERHFEAVEAATRLPAHPGVALYHHSVGSIAAALEHAGFVPSAWYEADSSRDLTPCLAFEAGKEKW